MNGLTERVLTQRTRQTTGFKRMSVAEMRDWLNVLADQGLLERTSNGWRFTPAGRAWFEPYALTALPAEEGSGA